MFINKRVTIDLRTAALLGPSCKFFEMLAGYQEQGYIITLIDKSWGEDTKLGSGTKFDERTKSFDRGDSKYLWDPNLHPRDIIDNLIVPTFPCITVVRGKKDNSLLSKIKRHLNYMFNPFFLTYHDFGTRFLGKSDFKDFISLRKQEIWRLGGARSWLLMTYFLGQMYVFRHFKVYAKSKGFRYKLSKEKYTKSVRDFIAEARQDARKNILISVLWDDKMVFEKQTDRLRGGPNANLATFDNLLKYVKQLDTAPKLRGAIKFVLASKKAVDWSSFLETEFVDLRNFEELGFSMSQSIYITQEISDLSINWPSTYSIWITNCSDILHLNWHSDRDIAAWARNQMHELPAIDIINEAEKALGSHQ